ncbi:MAG: hypothetical protein HQ596_00605 [Candidatus Saganbacteria bacterium]|nr:hypothetical protein [Candidatus Saganbacteria bacterium]
MSHKHKTPNITKAAAGKDTGVRFEQPRNPDYEEGGIIKISGAFLLDHEEDILNLVKHEGKLAEERNPNARVIEIAKINGGIEVKTSDHNLAMRIGKALSRSYKGEHHYNFRKGEKYAEVVWKRD